MTSATPKAAPAPRRDELRALLPRLRIAPGWDPAIEGDRLALALTLARDRVVVPLARAARAFVRDREWLRFGHARLEDHARERFGRCGRWVRDLAALGEATDRMPVLAEALTGDDGGAPIGRAHALLIAKQASPDSCAAWIRLARSSTVRELRAEIQNARAAGQDVPMSPRETADARTTDEAACGARVGGDALAFPRETADSERTDGAARAGRAGGEAPPFLREPADARTVDGAARAGRAGGEAPPFLREPAVCGEQWMERLSRRPGWSPSPKRPACLGCRRERAGHDAGGVANGAPAAAGAKRASRPSAGSRRQTMERIRRDVRSGLRRTHW